MSVPTSPEASGRRGGRIDVQSQVRPRDTAAAAGPRRIDRLSDPVFIGSWIANFLLVTANAALFIFADWVAWLASSGIAGPADIYHEELPGRIVQTGLIAAILSRLFLGRTIDRFGVRRVWLVMSLLTLCGSVTFAATSHLSNALYAGRILYAVGVSGMFTCSAFHIQACVAEHRRTEFLGLLGSSGFVGMTMGTQLADALRRFSGAESTGFRRTFLAVIACNVVYGILVWFVTRGFPRPAREIRPSLLFMMKQYWPGPIVVVAAVMGLVFTVPSLYLVRFNGFAGLGGISGYWTAYAVSAFVIRLATAQLSQTVGRYRLITVGLAAQGIGLLGIIPASQSWHLLIPAVICGLGHALLFPSIVSLGAQRFPGRYRGSGTNLAMGFVDFGTALSAPLLGRIIDLDVFGGVGYRPMFFAAGMTAVLTAIVWHVTHRNRIDCETTA